MAINNGYATRAELTRELDSSGSATLDNTRIDRIVEQASRIVDSWTRRRFYPVLDTRYFTAQYADWLDIDDLLELTTFKTDDNDDGTHETTWTQGTDFLLEPFNALIESTPHPYMWITNVERSGKYFPRNVRKGVEIVGKWGHYDNTMLAAVAVSGVHTASTTSLLVATSAAEFAIGHLLKIGGEYMQVDSVNLETRVLTVKRGINGSTSAALAGDEAIDILTFPVISEAVLRLSTRIWHLRTAPLGVATAGVAGMNGSTAGTRWMKDDTDLQDWLDPFVRRL